MIEQILYCITHNSYGTIRNESPICLWTSCPPPELPDEWELIAVSPSDGEMVLIDQNAMELAFDLEWS